MKNILKILLGKINCILYRIGKYGKRNYIGKRNKILGGKNIEIGNNISIRPEGFISCNQDAKIIIEDNSDIGTRVRMNAAVKIKINKNVLIGPNVYIADQDHEYKNPNVPIMYQGVKKFDKGIEIGEGTWIGINSVIVGNVKIGKNCVIGANTIVNKDIPDYCVAVGAPVKIIKKYNNKQKMWEKTV